MFRRKEDGLFDSDVMDENESSEGVSVITPAAGSSSAPANPYSASGQTAARTATPTAANTPSQASNTPSSSTPFRASSPTPAAQASMDAARPRVPEAKPTISSAAAPAPAASATPAPKQGSQRVLTVGNDILLKGEINTCDRLVIQGKVEATLNDVHTVELADTGTFKGTANVVEMQISGRFEGELVCTGRLVIHSSGKISGKITYGEIEIERGGEITGEIKTVSSSQAAPKAVRKEAA